MVAASAFSHLHHTVLLMWIDGETDKETNQPQGVLPHLSRRRVRLVQLHLTQTLPQFSVDLPG